MSDDFNSVATSVAATMIDIGAVTISSLGNRYVFASGLRSPVYFDGRYAISDLDARRLIVASAIDKISVLGDFDVVAGVATGGIPWAAWIADRLSKPLAYVRSKPKGRGLDRSVEGLVRPGDRVLVVEDLVTTATSSIRAVEAVRQEGGHVESLFSIFTYALPIAKTALERAELSHLYLTDLDSLLFAAESRFDRTILADLRKWRDEELPFFVPPS